MTDTPEQRVTQLESIVNELTARIAADPGSATCLRSSLRLRPSLPTSL